MTGRTVPRPDLTEDVDFWMRHIDFGVRVTWATLAAAFVYFLLSGIEWRSPLMVVLVATFVATAAIRRLPWPRILEQRRAVWWFYGWTGGVTVILTVAVAYDGGVSSPLILYFTIPALFAAIAYPPRAVFVLSGAMVASVGVMALVADGSDTARTWQTLAVLTLSAWTFTHAASNYRDSHQQTRRLAEKLASQVHVDSLTGCLNHRRFQEVLAIEVARAQRMGRTLGLVMGDIDHFKQINDEHGHRVGDEVLERVGTALREHLRDGDSVARVGGEEFAVLLPDCDDGQHLVVAERLRRVVGQINDPVRVTMSFGVAVMPEMADEAEQLLELADRGLYAAKAAGRDAVAVHGEAAGDGEVSAVEGRVTKLLRSDRITSHYQPIVDLRDGTVVAYEALARIEDSQLRPDQWLALAEETGQRVELEVAMLDAAIAGWPFAAPRLPGVPRLFVNLSPDVLATGALWPRLRELTDRRVVIEISERSPILSYESLRSTLADLTAAGLGLAIDDVGAGHANMRHVLELRPDYVKLDRSLVAGVDSHQVQASLLRALAAFASENAVSIIAEGIERPAEASVCVASGADLGQGYLIARPAPPLVEPEWRPVVANPA